MIKCWLFGHKPLLLETLDKKPPIVIYEKHYLGMINKAKPLVDIHMCERCKYVYWIPAI